VGIRGTVRRSTDSWFVHCNVDTDVIIWEGDPGDPTRKPPEMYQLIENFCLGTRRLELFGRAHSLRRGWVTVVSSPISTSELEEHNASLWDKDEWDAELKNWVGKQVVPNTPEIDALRPKSPVRNSSQNHPPPGGMQTSPMQNQGMHMAQPLPQAPMPMPMAMAMNMPMNMPMQPFMPGFDPMAVAAMGFSYGPGMPGPQEMWMANQMANQMGMMPPGFMPNPAMNMNQGMWIPGGMPSGMAAPMWNPEMDPAMNMQWGHGGGYQQ